MPRKSKLLTLDTKTVYLRVGEDGELNRDEILKHMGRYVKSLEERGLQAHGDPVFQLQPHLFDGKRMDMEIRALVKPATSRKVPIRRVPGGSRKG